ncbi:melanocortin receptor 4 [Elysia marginata]|uniref:Melanocortin receptor 4 n=1 Tax=Elysia marginata TaxID=1093978 RepID=A0AAV4F5Z5_9GAST|nr:melanocortin receptor 4 [Elysia marginata]
MDVITTSSFTDGAGSTISYLEDDASYSGCSEEDLYLPAALRYVLTTFGLILIIENTLLIVTIARHKELHSNSNILVASLAISDVVIGLLCLQMSTLSKPTGLRSMLGVGPPGLRKFDSFASGANCGLIVVSMAHLAALSVDRYLYILWPLQYFRRVTQRRVIALAVGIWIVGCTYIVLPIFVYSDRKYHKTCFIFNTPNDYAGGPLMASLCLCITTVCASTFGIAKLALDHDRKREIRKKGGVWSGAVDKYTGGEKREAAEKKQCYGPNCDEGPELELEESLKQDGGVVLATINLRPVTSSESRRNTLFATESGPRFKSRDKKDGSVTARPHVISFTSNREMVDFNIDLNESEQKDGENLVATSIEMKYYDEGLENRRDPIFSVSVANDFERSSGERNLGTLSVVNKNDNGNERCPFTQTSQHQVALNGTSTTTTSSAATTTTIQPKQNVQDNKLKNEKKAARTRPWSRAKLKVLKFVVMIFGCYLVCVFPSLVVMIFHQLSRVVRFSNTTVVSATLVLFLNSGVNFFIMIHTNKNFREILSSSGPYKLLKLCLRQGKRAMNALKPE